MSLRNKWQALTLIPQVVNMSNVNQPTDLEQCGYEGDCELMVLRQSYTHHRGLRRRGERMTDDPADISWMISRRSKPGFQLWDMPWSIKETVAFFDQDSESCLYHIEHVYIQSLQSWDPSYPVSFVGDMWTPLVEKTWEEYCDVSNYGTNTRSMVPKRLLSSFSWILCLEPVNWLGLGCCLDRWVGLVSLDVCRQHPLSFLQPQPLTFRQQKTVRYETVFNTEMQRIDGNCQCPLQATELGFHTLHYMTWKIH